MAINSTTKGRRIHIIETRVLGSHEDTIWMAITTLTIFLPIMCCCGAKYDLQHSLSCKAALFRLWFLQKNMIGFSVFFFKKPALKK